MYSIEQRIPATDPVDDRLVAPFDLRQKSRARVTLASGAEAGLFLERGTVLRHGDCLKTDCGRVIRVEAAPEQVLTVRADSPAALLRAAYHLGNRHVPLDIGADRLRLGSDPVLRDMLVGLGVWVVEEQAPFEPEGGAYPGAYPGVDQGGQGHHHGHGDHSHQHPDG
jgi:urease accessory protein